MYDVVMLIEYRSIILLGRYAENIARGRTSDALSQLMDLQPASATLCHFHDELEAPSTPTSLGSNDEGVDSSLEPPLVQREEQISFHLVQVGDVLKVIRGEKIPVDGVVRFGSSSGT